MQPGETALIRSDGNRTGFKGVHLNKGRYEATCQTAPCHKHHLGSFGTPEEAAQAYLRHWVKDHQKELVSKKRKAPSS